MARELNRIVVYGGTVYGPGYENPPPSDVAAVFTNPDVWGEVPDSDPEPVVSPPGGPAQEPETPAPNGPAVPTPTEEPENPVKPSKPPILVPPRSGTGSGIGAWRAFADYHEVSYPAAASRDQIVEACEQAKVI